jgi:UDP-N-acetylmuramoyl-tripeptide--D-alanyl-D-alanine ligase
MSIFMIVVFVVMGVYMSLNFKRDIHMMQQNSYRLDRFWRWQKDELVTIWRLVDVALLFLLFSTMLNAKASALILAISCVVKIIQILRAKYKKPLVFTKRVWRIYGTVLILPILASLALILLGANGKLEGIWTSDNSVVIPLGGMLIFTIFSWAFTMAAVWCLKPVEKAINQKYWNEANSILRSMTDLKIVGITGSFGKTSTKHYLHRILSEEYDVLMTPGSYNTPMGVIRTVREMMKPHNQIFICEMGAKQLGDIKEICDLVHPHIGVVTAVGPMHLESFKSMENVQKTKFELVDALPADGLAIVNNDFPYCANRQVTNVETLRYAVSNPDAADYKAANVVYTPQGTNFDVVTPEGETLSFTTKLVGECNISNLIGAIIVAIRLNVPYDKIRYAVSRIEQVEHRLNLKQTPGGVTIIDDAFNSNPFGSKMAVDVLHQFSAGQRIIVTPGMIELGDKQFELNRELGKYIGEKVDVAIIVGEYNRDALVSGVRDAALPEEQLHIVDSFNEAQKLLSTILKAGDTILYENDLPDTFK